MIALFRDGLGYGYLDNWTDRTNHNVEESLLRPWLAQRGHAEAQINRALDVLGRDLAYTGRDLHHDNQAVYGRLRYGVPVKTDAGEFTQSIMLIDWAHPEANDFGIAETIENNVRSRIIQKHLNDPDFYEKMSQLLDEVIRFRKAHADHYAEYLKRIADLAGRVQAGHDHGIPDALRHSTALRAIFNNLKPQAAAGDAAPCIADETKLALAEKIDAVIRRVRPAGWRDNPAKENIIKSPLLPLLGSEAEVERIFEIIKRQVEY